MKCLIVAAGQGTRLREKGALKPLIKIRGTPLIERVIATAQEAGCTEFFVVSGYRGDELRRALNTVAARKNLRLTHVVNEKWDRANGVSVLAAKQYLDEPFILTMCDHLVDPAIVADLIALPPGQNVTLAVDRNLDNPLNDPEDVTRVQCADQKIERIGKIIRDYNAYDTGVFRCAPVIFAALEESQRRGDDSISGAINVLAGWGQAQIMEIGAKIWVDVDDPAAFAKAEALIDSGRL